LIAAYQLFDKNKDRELVDKIMEAIKKSIEFQLHTQFMPESILYLKDPQRALGAFKRSLTNFEIRIDYVQHNISSLLGFMKITS